MRAPGVDACEEIPDTGSVLGDRHGRLPGGLFCKGGGCVLRFGSWSGEMDCCGIPSTLAGVSAFCEDR